MECWVLVIGKYLEEFGVVISIAKRVGHARVCPTVRGATFSPRTWDQGSLCPGFGPKIRVWFRLLAKQDGLFPRVLYSF